MAFILSLQCQYLALKYTPLSNGGMGGVSLFFKYHYNTKLKDGNYSIPTKKKKKKVPRSLVATALESLKLSLPASKKNEEKQKGLATEAAVLIV